MLHISNTKMPQEARDRKLIYFLACLFQIVYSASLEFRVIHAWSMM